MWLQLHHAVFFSPCGETVRANLVSLCSRCHKCPQEQLAITGNADGTLTFTNGQGDDLGYAHPLDVADWLNFWLGWTGDEQDRHGPRGLKAS